MKLLAVFTAVLVMLAIMFGGAYISAYNTANSLEATIKAAYTDSQNVLSQYGQRIAEASQVPTMQTEDLIRVFTAANESRYGNPNNRDGVAMQWIQEQNPNLDQGTYKSIVNMIEAGRTEFRAAQTRLIDVKATYDRQRGSFLTGTLMSIAGFPRINLDDYQIVVTQRTLDAFSTGVEQPIQLR